MLALAMAPAAAASEARLQPGRYLVEARLELAYLSVADATKQVSVCIDDTTDPAAALRVLSSNNPLASCPIASRRITGSTVHFEVACQGLNAAKGSAVFELARDSYRGCVPMKMGGKNMTMTEHQTGRRVGPCKVCE